jgi:hypothetical protein
MVIAGWVMTALFALFMLGASAAPKFLKKSVATAALSQLGWPLKYLLLIALIELLGTVLFVIPGTGLLGAVFLTGLLGGSLASNLRAGSPLFSHTLFSVYLGVFMWVALCLRDAELRVALSLAG